MEMRSLKISLEDFLMNAKNNHPDNSMSFELNSDLLSGTYCRTTIDNFTIYSDQPSEMGGTNGAPNPIELVLAAAASSQEILYSNYAAILNISLYGVHVEMKGTVSLQGFMEMDPNIRPRLSGIEYSTTVISSADNKDLEKLREVVEIHCPILNTLSRSVDVVGHVRFVHPSEAQAQILLTLEPAAKA